MSLWMMPAELSCWFALLAGCLDLRSQARFLGLLGGVVFARGRRTVTSWLRAAGVADDFRPAYALLWTVGRRSAWMATRLLLFVLLPRLGAGRSRLLFGLDDTPTKRYGPCVQGAGIHHNPTPGPAGQKFVYGHVWVTLARLVRHPWWGSIALPLRASLYVRQKDVARLPPEYGWTFRTELALAVELLHWLAVWLRHRGVPLWPVADGAYACREVLRAARRDQMTVVSRLRKDAALCDLPGPRPAGRRGRPPIYGRHRLDLAKRRPAARLANRGVRAVRADGDRALQDVPGDVAAGRGRYPGGAGGAGQGLGGVLLHRPDGVRGGRADGRGGSGVHRAGVPRPQGGVGRGAAAVAERVGQHRGVPPQPVAAYAGGGLGLGPLGRQAG